MERRDLLKVLSIAAGVASGCTSPTVSERPTGELDVTFETRADQNYLLRLELVDADGQTVDEFESELPPDEPDRPNFYAGGLSNGPYTVTIETDTDRQTFEWSVSSCRHLTVDVTVVEDGLLEYESACTAAEN